MLPFSDYNTYENSGECERFSKFIAVLALINQLAIVGELFHVDNLTRCIIDTNPVTMTLRTYALYHKNVTVLFATSFSGLYCIALTSVSPYLCLC